MSARSLLAPSAAADSPSSKSSASSTHSDSSDPDPPAAYHLNLLNLLPSLQLPPRLRTAHRQAAGSLDVLAILAKAVLRPRPTIHLGPIDHTASCVIVDLDLADRPLVWASESFCHMSGYALDDIRGRNPRFMQAPGGHVLSHDKSPEYIPPPRSHVHPGAPRPHTSQVAVQLLKAKLDAHEEVQTTILNYRKDGTRFWNWLSIVPVREAAEGSRFRYHVGIMVDLVQQPRAIMQTMQAGLYVRTPP